MVRTGEIILDYMGREYINTTSMVDPWSKRDDLFKFRKLTRLKFCVHFFKIRKCPEGFVTLLTAVVYSHKC